jgi:hypothetical protein
MDTPIDGEAAHINMLAVKCLKLDAFLAGELGKAQDSEKYLKTSAELSALVNRHFWSADQQAYVDSIHADDEPSSVASQQTNTIACLTGCADADRIKLVETRVASPAEGTIKYGTPFLLFFVTDTLAGMSRVPDALSLIRKEYGTMLDRGVTAWCEHIEGSPDAVSNLGFWSRSYCHGWSSGPTYILSAYVLGVKPTQPGFKKVLVTPNPCGLTWAKGKVPTPNGEIEVSWKIEGDTMNVTVSSPKQSVCEVKLPEGSALKPVVNITYY